MDRNQKSYLAKFLAAVMLINTGTVSVCSASPVYAASEGLSDVAGGSAAVTATQSNADRRITAQESGAAALPASPSDAICDEDGLLLDGEVTNDIHVELTTEAEQEIQEKQELELSEYLKDGLIGAQVSDAVFVEEDGFVPESEEYDFSDLVTASSDDLLWSYFEKELKDSADTSSKKGLRKAPRHDNLEGNDLIVYEALKENIEQVACGNEADTVFEVSLSLIDPALIEGITEDELELSASPCTYADGQWIWNDDAKNEGYDRMAERISTNLNSVFKALVADCPYDLYWNTKKVSFMGPQCAVSVSYSNGKTTSTYRYNDPAVLTYSFEVTPEYRTETNEAYVADTEKTSAAVAAAENAKQIVHDAGSYSDYEKLVYYRDKICERTSYNHDALQAGNSEAYGSMSPWQVINVFDDDWTNQVVCEGYSKAFQYLCDMSEFTAGTDCISPTGIMDGGTGEGPHMWNIVRMDDGLNYLVDVTNCDEGTVGSPDRLFLRGFSSGNLEDGYCINIALDDGSGNEILYIYGEDTTALYKEEELTLAAQDYVYQGQEPEVRSGQCGEKITWSFADNGTLSFYGSGDMWDDATVESVPWYNWRLQICRVEMSDEITRISHDAFRAHENLTEIHLPECLTEIPDGMLANCFALEAVTIPQEVQRIGVESFSGCSSLEFVTYGPSVQYVDERAFDECSMLRTVYFEGTQEQWNSVYINYNGNGALINAEVEFASGGEEGVTASGSCGQELTWKLYDTGLFVVDGNGEMADYLDQYGEPHLPWEAYSDSVREVQIGDGVLSISPYAFAKCNYLENVSLGESLCSIQNNAFYADPLLTQVIIPDTVSYIGDEAFSSCDTLQYVYISAGVSGIEGSPFSECNSLQEITLDSANTNYLTIEGVLFSADGETLITYPIGKKEESYVVPDGVKRIEPRAFARSLSLKTVVLPEGLEEIGESEFYDCQNLENISIPDSVTALGYICFGFCLNLKNLKIGEGLSEIPADAFYFCRSLTEVEIPRNIHTIGSAAFDYCSGITDVWYGGTKAEWNAIEIGDRNTNLQNAILHCQDDVSETVIITHPEPVTVFLGETVTMHVQADGTNLSYQWYYSYNGTSWARTSVSGNKTSTISFEATEARNGAMYRCKVTGDGGTVRSESALLTVVIPPAETVITTQPVSVMAEPGEQVTMTVEATGDNLRYLWYYSFNGTSWARTSVTGNRTSTITFEATEARNGAMYRCKVTGDGGSITSSAATLTVRSVEETSISTQPVSVTAYAGEIVSMFVEASGTDLSYQWYYSYNGTKWSRTSVSGNKTSRITMEATEARNGAMYHCVVSGEGGTVTSEDALLTVKTAEVTQITEQPEDVTALPGAIVSMHVEADGSNLSYQWYYTFDGENWARTSVSGNKTSTITMEATEARNGAMYRCVVTGENDSVTSNPALLTLIQVDETVITRQPESVTVEEGTIVSMYVEASGTDLSYQWQYSYTGDKWSRTSVSGNKTARITMEATEARNGAMYRCVVTGEGGTATSEAALLTVTAPPAETEIVTQPVSVTAELGEQVTITVGATGDNLSYQWYYSYNGTNWSRTSVSGNKTDTITFEATEARNGAMYRCKVTGDGGTVTSSPASLTVVI